MSGRIATVCGIEPRSAGGATRTHGFSRTHPGSLALDTSSPLDSKVENEGGTEFSRSRGGHHDVPESEPWKPDRSSGGDRHRRDGGWSGRGSSWPAVRRRGASPLSNTRSSRGASPLLSTSTRERTSSRSCSRAAGDSSWEWTSSTPRLATSSTSRATCGTPSGMLRTSRLVCWRSSLPPLRAAVRRAFRPAADGPGQPRGRCGFGTEVRRREPSRGDRAGRRPAWTDRTVAVSPAVNQLVGLRTRSSVRQPRRLGVASAIRVGRNWVERQALGPSVRSSGAPGQHLRAAFGIRRGLWLQVSSVEPLLKDNPWFSRPQVVIHDRHALLVWFSDEREAKAPMECDRPGVDGRGQSLELRAPPRSSASFDLLIEPPTDPAALVVPPNRDQMDVAGWAPSATRRRTGTR